MLLGSAQAFPLALVLGSGYLVFGSAMALWLARKGHPAAVTLGALVCWPLFVPLVTQTPQSRPAGPLHAEITAAMGALREALTEPGAAGLDLPDDADRLEDELHRADERLAAVDRLLASITRGDADPRAGFARGIGQLEQARAASAAQIHGVLDGVVQLRLQIGLRSLAGNSVPVQERLSDLRTRLAVIDEVAALELSG